MKRVFYHYHLWEDYKSGMWRDVKPDERARLMQKALVFRDDIPRWEKAMMRVIREWPISSEHNLTNVAANRRAWLGQAACTIEIRCPEDIARQVWGKLSQEQQDKANAAAERVIKIWEKAYAKKNR